jgi:hypothetical protein
LLLYSYVKNVIALFIMDTGRQADLTMLQNQLRNAPPGEARKIERTMHNIQHESPLQQSMRQQLIKAHRNGDTKTIKEIGEYVAGNKKFSNDR